ncbi:hypothetical protein [Methanolobus psychrotolerans]|uniref:hypothetical protein n=1 Tax=Methanolobus psychrotolerans TaxID=1874706 RepID=UPI00101AE914|nr:hypothetical protein [Methanolobus psychrotolerans]
MVNTISILRFLSFLGFLFANLISLIFFNHFISEVPIFAYIAPIFISLLIFKADFTIWAHYSLKERLFSKNKDPAKDPANKKTIKVSVGKLLSLKYCVVLMKQTFFNTLYELFPVYFIWLSVFGFFFWIDVLKIAPNAIFYQVIAIFGILLGIFQFSLKRYEDKIAIKMAMNTKIITNILNEETSFDEFYQSLDDNNDKALKNWINNSVDPKIQTIDYLKSIARDDDAVKMLKTIMRKTRTTGLINVNYSPQDSNQKFQTIENMCETDKKRKEELIKAYSSFFETEETIKTIVKKIKDEIDFKEFGITAISNINIISEVIPQFASSKFRNLFDDMLTEATEFPEKGDELTHSDELISSKELRNNLYSEILKRLIAEIIN